MKNTKRLIALLAAVTMLSVTALTGCSTAETPDVGTDGVSKADSKTESKAEEPAKKEEPIKISYYMQNSPLKDFERIMAKADEISLKEINATLDLICVDGATYGEKMNMMINSAEAFDLCFTANWGGMDYFQNAAKGAYKELTPEMISELAPKSYANVPEELWDGVKVNGKIYSIINYQQWGISLAKGVGLRKDLADEFGFDWKSVKKLEDLEPFMDKVKANKKEMIPFEYQGGGEDTFTSNSLMWGMDPIGDNKAPGWVKIGSNEKPTVINQYETEEYKAYLDMMRRWYQKGYVRSDCATLKDFLPDRQANKIAVQMIQGFPDSITEPAQIPVQGMSHTKPGDAPAVTINLMKPFAPAGGPSTAATAIGANSKNPEKALEMIEFINTNDEYFRLITLGEENVDWEYTKEAKGTSPIGTFSNIDGKYNFNWMDWAFGQSYSANFTRAAYAQNEQGELAKKMQAATFEADLTGDRSPVMGFTFDPTPVKTQMANCGAITAELISALGSGSIDPVKGLPDFIKRLKDAGADDIVKEKQTQIDAWYATK